MDTEPENWLHEAAQHTYDRAKTNGNESERKRFYKMSVCVCGSAAWDGWGADTKQPPRKTVRFLYMSRLCGNC